MVTTALEWLRPHSVPLGIVAVLAVAALFVPPLVLNPSAETYAITAAILVLAVVSSVPYAVGVSLLTLPPQYLGSATYASPGGIPDEGKPKPTAALRHAGAGVTYVLSAGAVGGIGIGVDVASSASASTPPTGVPFTYLAGGVVGVVFVALQLWRYDAPLSDLETQTVIWTVGLGLLLVPAGRVAIWVFGGGLPF
ncbi:hypothetical protein BRC85_11705 [Halobacteriales archaeon QS_1_69_70]|nr:MAG: hypothetical protein BRC85_11705 [Halobacteriales archaeon QS_1_69_70]